MKENYQKLIPRQGNMLVPGIVFASDKLFKKILHDRTIEQIMNVACLPGIVRASMAMPDAHVGYGMPIGGVAAFDLKNGIVSPGAVGYDINCGVRLLVSDVPLEFVVKKRAELVNEIFKRIPSGTGKDSAMSLSVRELNEILDTGAAWAVKKGYATGEDAELTEDGGAIVGASSKAVSTKAKERGRTQIGTLGSGNHFIELQTVEKLLDAATAKAFGLQKDAVVVMIHSGSRGLGHQVASDFIQKMEKEYGHEHLPDRGLACAPISSKLGKEYLGAMAAAANFAFVNRQLMTHALRESFAKIFGKSSLKLVYDIAHNIAKVEPFVIEGKRVDLCVHRKGATRSFGPGRRELPVRYRKTGSPIFLPGSMGTASFVLAGTAEAERVSFASAAHGAGRVLSRSYALEHYTPEKIRKGLEKKDILLKARSEKGIPEEAPEVYKDVDEVARVSEAAGLGKLVARLRPLAVIKG